MKILGKSFLDYLKDSGIFIAIALTITIPYTILRLNESLSPVMQSISSIILTITIIWAGFRTIKIHGYKLIQTGFVGLIIFLTTIWSLLIFHPLNEVIYILIINAILCAIIAIIGGLLAKVLLKFSNKS